MSFETVNVTDVNEQRKISKTINRRIKEFCNCDQALEQAKVLKKALKLCNKMEYWRNWSPNKVRNGITEYQYLVEVMTPFADELKKEIRSLK